MKARVIETGEIIDVKCLYPTIYSRLDCNGKIVSEYDEDEIELISNANMPKKISLNDAVEWLNENTYKYLYGDIYKDEKMIEDFYNYFK